MGLSGSSAEAEDLANVNSTFASQQFQIGQSMAQQGLSAASDATGQESSLLKEILSANTSQEGAFGSTLSDFLKALEGGPGKTVTTTTTGG